MDLVHFITDQCITTSVEFVPISSFSSDEYYDKSSKSVK